MSGAAEAFPIQGTVAPGFEAVQACFRENFEQGVECGAGFAVLRDGEPLVDLVGGFTSADRSRSWAPDTLVSVYSTTKGIVALAIATLVADGAIDLDAPVARYWPEFAAAGKAEVTVAQMLSHQAGLVGLRDPVTLEDHYAPEALAARLAAAEPLWTPGTAMGYHPITWGTLAGELIRRVTGVTAGELVRTRIADPADADFHLGLPASEHHRCADLIGPNRPWREMPGITDAPPGPARPTGPLQDLANNNPVIRPFRDVASPAYREAELPAANGHGTALALARIYAAVIDPETPIVPAAGLAAALREVVGPEQEDLVLAGRRFRRSAAGLMLNHDGIYGPHPDAFGHDGAGGSFGFADPANRLAMGYVMNQMQVHPDADQRGRRLMRAVHACMAQ